MPFACEIGNRVEVALTIRPDAANTGAPQMTTDLQTDKLIRHTRNPFGVMDVPEPDGPDVIAFAATASLEGRDDDANAAAWAALSSGAEPGAIEGRWSSRWNGGGDPTIAGDAPD